jgi:hypothetical protein
VRRFEGRAGSTTASTAFTAQYAPKTPKTTLKIEMLQTTKPAKSAFTISALAGSPPVKTERLQLFESLISYSNLSIYTHLTPASANN